MAHHHHHHHQHSDKNNQFHFIEMFILESQPNETKQIETSQKKVCTETISLMPEMFGTSKPVDRCFDFFSYRLEN